MRVKVLFFGQLKDVVGAAEESLEAGDGATLASVFEHYAGRFARLNELRPSIVMAKNHQFAAPNTAVSDGDEVAFLPPVSGGSMQEISDAAGHWFALTRQTIDIASLKARVAASSDGAVVVFEGIVRNNSGGRRTKFLDYEGYEPMALQTIAAIGREIASEYQTGRVGMVHRLGRMEIGETSVAIVVASPHRKAAFAAAHAAIDRLKKRVPIWKKEHFEDGEVWVEGEWDDSVLQR